MKYLIQGADKRYLAIRRNRLRGTAFATPHRSQAAVFPDYISAKAAITLWYPITMGMGVIQRRNGVRMKAAKAKEAQG